MSGGSWEAVAAMQAENKRQSEIFRRGRHLATLNRKRLPTARDLDAVAEEEQVRMATSGAIAAAPVTSRLKP